MILSEENIRDYFFDRCTQEVANEVQQMLADGDSDVIDSAMLGILAQLEGDSRLHAGRASEAYAAFVRAVHERESRSWSVRARMAGRWMVRVAAMLALPLAVLAAWLYTHQASTDQEWIDVTVPAGECQALRLPDGTVLDVNAGSRVIYPREFAGKERRIFVTGELFADVAKDPEHPFVISVGDVSVQVLGTKFNLRAYDDVDNIELALVEGSVKFKAAQLEGVVLHPGELMQYHRVTRSLIRDTFDPEGYLCPAKGTGFFFNNLPLKDIAVQLEYSFNVCILIDNPKLLSNTYTAYFSNGEGIDEILSKINNSGSDMMQITRQGRIIHISVATQKANK